jgi:hypothetical protein
VEALKGSGSRKFQIRSFGFGKAATGSERRVSPLEARKEFEAERVAKEFEIALKV